LGKDEEGVDVIRSMRGEGEGRLETARLCIHPGDLTRMGAIGDLSRRGGSAGEKVSASLGKGPRKKTRPISGNNEPFHCSKAKILPSSGKCRITGEASGSRAGQRLQPLPNLHRIHGYTQFVCIGLETGIRQK